MDIAAKSAWVPSNPSGWPALRYPKKGSGCGLGRLLALALSPVLAVGISRASSAPDRAKPFLPRGRIWSDDLQALN